MTDIFISYKREERDQARRLAEALTARGYAVWWDAEILPGEQYRAVTLKILETCDAAIVIWSPRSTGSSWVLDEAQRALDRGVLVPVHLEPISGYPLGFGQVHAHNLVGWEGAPEDAKFQPVLAAVERLAARRQSAPRPTPDAEIAFWRGIQDSANPSDFEAYLARYGKEGLFSALARDRLNALNLRPILPPIPPPPPPSPLPAVLRQSFSRWELGFIAAVLAVAGFALWPIANVITDNDAFLLIDYTSMFLLGYAQNVFVMTPLLTAAAWAFDRAAAWCAAQASIVRHAPLILPPLILLVLIGLTLKQRDESYAENAYYMAAEMTHFYLWIAVAWGAALVTRAMTPRFKQALQSIGIFKS